MLGKSGGFALLLAGEYMIGAKPQYEYLQHDYTSVSRIPAGLDHNTCMNLAVICQRI
jgi:hypothetical protein